MAERARPWFLRGVACSGAWELSESAKRYTGGCLCGQLRYEAEGEPLYAGLCYCTDCQKASGSGLIPFMGFASSAVRFSGRTLQYTTKAANGGDAVAIRVRSAAAWCSGEWWARTPHSRSMRARWMIRPPFIRRRPSSPAAVRLGRSSRRDSRSTTRCRRSRARPARVVMTCQGTAAHQGVQAARASFSCRLDPGLGHFQLKIHRPRKSQGLTGCSLIL